MKSLLAATLAACFVYSILAYSTGPAFAGASNPMSQSYNAVATGKSSTGRADVRKQQLRGSGQSRSQNKNPQ